MIGSLPEKPEPIITDLKEFDSRGKSLSIVSSCKNIDRLQSLSIENLWILGANDKELRRILPQVTLKYLNIYQVLAKDLSILESQKQIESIKLEWSSKALKLWDFSKNINLRNLEILDFSKLEDIKQFSFATQVRSLVFSGGNGKPIKIEALKPFEKLNNLTFLGLSNLRVLDGSLKPLGSLKNLKKLSISNQFETKEYAWLATRLIETECNLFKAVTACDIKDIDGRTEYDTMVTGKRKPFLLSSKDQAKIDKYINDFEDLKREFSK